MRKIEFVVRGSPPPRNVGKKSMWNHKTESPRVIALRRGVPAKYRRRKPLEQNIKLTIRIQIPEKHIKPGDLDNSIKGICDSLSIPEKALEQKKSFKVHEDFELYENRAIHPERFRLIKDDGEIVKIVATKKLMKSKQWKYKVIIEGE
jgi:Holliday junction resolvase RusA-like endonuclease